jgi:hypothetical protein
MIKKRFACFLIKGNPLRRIYYTPTGNGKQPVPLSTFSSDFPGPAVLC